MRDALRAGVGVREFWDLTPKELYQCFEAEEWRQTQARRRDAWLAWHTAVLTRIKRVPPLKSMIPGEVRPVDPEQRQREHEAIVERMGAPMKPPMNADKRGKARNSRQD